MSAAQQRAMSTGESSSSASIPVSLGDAMVEQAKLVACCKMLIVINGEWFLVRVTSVGGRRKWCSVSFYDYTLRVSMELLIPCGCLLLFLATELFLDQGSGWPRKAPSPEAIFGFCRHYMLSRVSSRYLHVRRYCPCPCTCSSVKYMAHNTRQWSFVTAALVFGPNPRRCLTNHVLRSLPSKLLLLHVK